MSAFDYLREASVLGGYDTVIRSGPSPEARLITVGEQPMVALYRITKVTNKYVSLWFNFS